MRPKKITIEAFGPYAKKEVIDFNELKSNNLFLISGPTGAGKTSIFDAMSYALYGESNGEYRGVDELRSHYASKNTLTRVRLEFSVKGYDYKITREPTQERPKKRGDGFTKHKTKATLKMLNEEPVTIITGVNEVDDKIIEILGIDAEQFRQIMMIPQGEFRKLLVSSSQERGKILQKLFDTMIYKKIQDNLKSKEKELIKKKEKIATRKNESINRLNYDNHKNLKKLIYDENKNIHEIIESLKSVNRDDKKRLKKLDDSIEGVEKNVEKLIEKKTSSIEMNKKIDKFEKLKKKIKEFEDKKDKAEDLRVKVALAKKAKDIKPLHDQAKREADILKEKEKELATIEKKKKDLDFSFEKIKKEYNRQHSKEAIKKRKNINKEIIKLKTLTDDVKSIDELESKKKSYLKSFKKIDKQIKTKDNKIKLLKDSIFKKKKKAKKLTESNDLVKINKDITTHQRNLQGLETLHDLKVELNQLNNKYSIKNKELKNKRYVYEKSDEKFKKNKMIFLNNQASILARELNEKDACPVCGSLDHPNVALFSEKSISEVELNKFEEAKDKAYKLYQKKEKSFDNLKKDIENIKKTFNKLLTDLSIIDKHISLMMIKKKINFKKNKLGSLIDIKSKAEKDANKVTQLRNKISVDEKSLDSLTNTRRKLDVKKNKLLNSITKIETKLDNVYVKVSEELRSTKKLNNKINSLSNEYKKLEEAFNKSEKKYNDYKINLEKVITNKEKSNKDVKSLSIRKDKLREKFSLTLKEKSFDYKTFQATFEDIPKISNYEQKLDKYDKEYNKVLNYKETLYKEIKGNEKIDIKALKEKIVTVNKKKRHMNKERGNIYAKIKSNESELNQIIKFEEKIILIEKKYKIVGRLSDVANGTTEKKISFERYVLAKFLDDIIAAANIRLNKMTSGRFTMLRTDKKERANKQSGLEIEVDDSYTGKRRHVKTLSGGESFKASLAMALGLSHVVQEYAGNVRLDTIFIDEGFGTLDSESLESAIDCLIDLQNSGRLVGIISHVDELKERISARLEVKKNNVGSETAFVVL